MAHEIIRPIVGKRRSRWTTFISDIRMVVEDARYQRKVEVTDDPEVTIPGHVVLQMSRVGLPHRRRYFLSNEDARALGRYIYARLK